MRRLWILPIWILAANGALFAQAPSISAVVDAGGYATNLAPGTIFVVKGSNLCTSSASANISAAAYSTAAMGGAAIAFTPTGGGSAINAFMIYSYLSGSVTQLAGELPNATAAGNYNVTVTTSAGTSAAFPATVVAQKPGLMTIPGSGSGRALVQNVVSATEYDLNGFTSGAVAGTNFLRSPAKPSEYLIAWGMGLGAAAGYDTSAPAAGLNLLAQGLDVKAVVGEVEITPAYAGRSNLFPGLDNITFQLPANITTGCFVSFRIKVAGIYSNATTIAIAPNASATACVDPNYDQATLAKLDSGGGLTGGSFSLSSFGTTISTMGQATNYLTEGTSGYFAKFTADTIAGEAALSQGSPGLTPGCLAYRTTYTFDSSVTGPTGSGLTLLDAGNITLNGPNVSNKPVPETSNTYTLSLSNAIPGGTPVIVAGTYTLTGSGGKDVGPFTASLTMPPPLQVTGGIPSTVNRSQDLVIAWTGGGTSLVYISGLSYVVTSKIGTISTYDLSGFSCTTTADKGSLTVPSSILSQLPATPASSVANGSAAGSLGVQDLIEPSSGTGNFSAPLTAGGTTDFGYFFGYSGNSDSVIYQ